MLRWLSVQIALVLSVNAACMPGVAQKFQEPTKEELQMTSDPQAPGASAEFLNREEVTDNANHFVSEYARIKILTEAGKEWAFVAVPFSGGAPPVIAGRTIHPDGTVVPLSGKASDLLSLKAIRNHARARVFEMPSAEVGSIVEYHWTVALGEGTVAGVTSDMQEFMNSALAGSIPDWDVQQDIPVRKERFYYNPLGDLEKNVIGNQAVTQYNSDGEIASYLLYSAHLPTGAHVQVSPKPDYTLEIQDVPAFPHEPDALPEAGRRYAVRFYYTPYLAADVYWADEGKRWSKEVDRQAEPTPALKDAAAQIAGGAGTDEQKARKLYDAVQGLANTSFQRGAVSAGGDRSRRTAEQVWNEKSGTRNELAIVFLALVRAAGLQANAMKVADRGRRIYDPGYLTLDQLTDILVVLHFNGNDVFVDPGEKFLPFGQLRWSHTLCGGLTQTADGASHTIVTPANDPKDSISAHTADLTIDTQGNVNGTVKLIANGAEALRWRQMNLTAGTDAVKQQLGAALQTLLPQGVSAQIENVQGLETAAGYLTAAANVNGSLGKMEGKRLHLPGFFFSTGAIKDFAGEGKREGAVDLHYAAQVIDDVVYHLPPGYSIESAPQATQLAWPQHAVLVVKTQTGAGTIDVKHIYARGFVVLDAKEYPALRDFAQKIVANDQQPLVLSQGNATGN